MGYLLVDIENLFGYYLEVVVGHLLVLQNLFVYCLEVVVAYLLVEVGLSDGH